MIFPPHNKDCAIFEEIINGKVYALHHPSSKEIGGNYIWLAESSNATEWEITNAWLKPGRNFGTAPAWGRGRLPLKPLTIYYGAADEFVCGARFFDKRNPFGAGTYHRLTLQYWQINWSVLYSNRYRPL
jgi:hypothetical protein